MLAEQGAQMTFPQALQWWRLLTRENSVLQDWHMVTLWSGIHTGAESPSFPSNLRTGLRWSRVMKVAFLLLYSSMALFRASSQSFLSCTLLKHDMSRPVIVNSLVDTVIHIMVDTKVSPLPYLALNVQLLTLLVMLNSFWKSSAVGTCTCSCLRGNVIKKNHKTLKLTLFSSL